MRQDGYYTGPYSTVFQVLILDITITSARG